MGHHINDAREFQSDLYDGTKPGKPDIGPDKIVLSFKDPLARDALIFLAAAYRDTDRELSDDICARLQSIHKDENDG